MEQEKKITMYDYILEEETVLNRIIDSGKVLSADFLRMLQKPVKEIVITGSGTSYHAAVATRRFLEKLLKIRVRAEYPMAFKDLQDIYEPATLLIGISQGGQSNSTTEALRKGKEEGIATVGISENHKAQIFEYSDIRILMECGPELSVAKTKGYIATVGILLMLGLEAALGYGYITREEYEQYKARMKATAANFPALIEGTGRWLGRVKTELLASRRLIVVGYGNHCATVMEGALKMLETMRYGICGYELEEFYHGIYNSIDKDTYLLYLGTQGPYKDKVKRLREVLEDTTSHQFIISGGIDGYEATNQDCMLPFVDDEDFSVLEYIIPIQIIASVLPYELGIDPFQARDPLFHKKVGSKKV